LLEIDEFLGLNLEFGLFAYNLLLLR
jgi:hypothetical protein